MNFRTIVFSAVLFMLSAAAAFAQDNQPPAATTAEVPVEQKAPEAAPQVPGPLVDDIHGISLGMTANEVRNKLGKPDTGDSTMMYYDLDKGEQVQLQLNAEKKVSMIAGIYLGKDADPPEFAEVFGPDAQPVRQEDGKIYRQVRYPSEGYWVAYSRLELESGPMTTVTIQKIAE